MSILVEFDAARREELAWTTELIARARARADAVKETIVVQDLKFVSTIRPPSNKQAFVANQHARDRNGRLIIFHGVQSINHHRLLCIL
jgi:hypothetical protein